jgi:hypothetical protein
MSPTITPMIPLRRVTRARARALGEYPSSSAAARTRARVPSATGWAERLSTREAVAIETPARRETSASDPFGGLDLAFVPIGASRRLERGEDRVGE